MKYFALVALAFVGASSISAQSLAQNLTSDGVEGAPDACHVFASSQQRLDCYDQLTGFGSLEVVAEQAISIWTFDERIDPITEREVSSIALAVDESEFRDSPEYLFIRCDGEGSSEIFITSGGYIGGHRDRVRVTYRWNDQEPVSESWHDSTNGRAAFLPQGYRDFRAGLEHGGRLAFQWLDYRGNRSSGIWENVALDESARYVLGGCQLSD